jgi:hypothetical protein
MLDVIILNVIMLNVIMLNAIILNAIILNVELNVIKLSVFMHVSWRPSFNWCHSPSFGVKGFATKVENLQFLNFNLIY